MDLKYLVKALSEHKLLYSEQERAAEVVKDLVVEIERLTAENEAIRKDRDDLLQQALGVEAERDIARMENERLRAALADIATTNSQRDRFHILDSVTQQLSVNSEG